jgi:3'-phosphoadenosine 5'-phosphosulfate sulfotransferase (PAPS reductase)/FAD synthetase
MTSDLKNIFSSGGGTQSAAIAALIVQGRLPKPDFVCIVDTERERGSTWEYLDAVIRPALQKVGLEVHRIRKSIWGTKPPHGVDYLSHNGSTVLLPNWTDQTGEPGKTPGYCSKTWKVETLQRYAREVLGVPTKNNARGLDSVWTSRGARFA